MIKMSLDECFIELGLTEGSTYNDVRAAFKNLVRDNHLDTTPTGDVRMLRINQAYDFLSDYFINGEIYPRYVDYLIDNNHSSLG